MTIDLHQPLWILADAYGISVRVAVADVATRVPQPRLVIDAKAHGDSAAAIKALYDAMEAK